MDWTAPEAAAVVATAAAVLLLLTVAVAVGAEAVVAADAPVGRAMNAAAALVACVEAGVADSDLVVEAVAGAAVARVVAVAAVGVAAAVTAVVPAPAAVVDDDEVTDPANAVLVDGVEVVEDGSPWMNAVGPSMVGPPRSSAAAPEDVDLVVPGFVECLPFSFHELVQPLLAEKFLFLPKRFLACVDSAVVKRVHCM